MSALPSDSLIRQQDRVLKPLHPSIAEHLMRQIMHYDKEFRREVATSAVGSSAKHWRFGSNGARGPMRPHPMLDRPGGLWACMSRCGRMVSSLQKIRLSSDWANPLNGSRNGRADGDGCVGLQLMQELRTV